MSVSYSSDSLLSGNLWTEDVHVEGQGEKSTPEVDMLAVGPDFHKTLRIPLLEGRALATADFTEAAEAAAVGQAQHSTATPSSTSSATESPAPAVSPVPVLVNASFVHTYFAGQNPLGKRLTEGGDSEHPKITKIWEIIGVTGDTKYNDLRRQIHPTIYVPRTGGRATFELRTAMSPQTVIPAVRKIVGDADKDLPVFGISTQSKRIDELLIQERLIARLGSCFGGLALLLACVGLYGLLSYEVAGRTREIGIRMALGAARADVLRGIAAQGLRITIIGITAGIVGGVAVTRFLSSLLFGLKASDPVTYLSVSLILIAVALVACYIPARRATKVDPMVALRYE
jgi:predicted permease